MMRMPGWRRVAAEISLVASMASVACVVILDLKTRAHLDDHTKPYILGAIEMGLLAIILGMCGLKLPNDSSGAVWCARMGLLLGLLVFGVFGVVLLTPQESSIRHRVAFHDNMKQVAMALRYYERAEGTLPPAVVRDPTGQPLYSWRVLILPYLREYETYKQFQLDEPWDSRRNLALLQQMPLSYERSGDDSYRKGRTAIEAISGPGTAFEGAGQPLRNPDGSSNFADGLDQTLMLVETEASVPWTAPTEVVVGPGSTVPPLGGGYPRTDTWFAADDPPTDFLAASADGIVRFLPRSLGSAKIRALATRNGGETVPMREGR